MLSLSPGHLDLIISPSILSQSHSFNMHQASLMCQECDRRAVTAQGKRDCSALEIQAIIIATY